MLLCPLENSTAFPWISGGSQQAGTRDDSCEQCVQSFSAAGNVKVPEETNAFEAVDLLV